MTTTVAIPESNDPRLTRVRQDVEGVIDVARKFGVVDAQTYADAATVLQTIKSLSRKADEERKSITAPMDAAKKRVMDLFRPMTDALNQAEAELKRRMLIWKSEQDRIAREERRKAEEAARKERERLERQAAKAEQAGKTERADTLRDRADMVVAAPPVSAPPKIEGIATRQVWKFEVTDAGKVPDQYKVVDEKKVGAVVRALKGDTDIPGIRVWAEEIVSARTA